MYFFRNNHKNISMGYNNSNIYLRDVTIGAVRTRLRSKDWVRGLEGCGGRVGAVFRDASPLFLDMKISPTILLFAATTASRTPSAPSCPPKCNPHSEPPRRVRRFVFLPSGISLTCVCECVCMCVCVCVCKCMCVSVCVCCYTHSLYMSSGIAAPYVMLQASFLKVPQKMSW